MGQAELPAFVNKLRGQSELYLTDGGVLENLGVKRLLASGTFGAKNIVISDAGVADSAWAPSLWQQLMSFAAFAFTRQTLARLLVMMNNKQSKTMRQYLLRSTGAVPESHAQRRLWFVRIDQDWERFFRGVPETMLIGLAGGDTYPDANATGQQVAEFLESKGIDLGKARSVYEQDRDCGKRANAVETSFAGLTTSDIEALEQHARWQVHACRAVYGELPEREPIVEHSEA